MRLKISFSLYLSMFLVLCMSIPASAEEPAFTLEVVNNQINLQANQASSKEILKDLEKKTGKAI